MKKWALIGAVAVLLAAVAVVGAQEILPDFEGFAQTLRDIQANYRAKYGRYAQILPMSSKGKAQTWSELHVEQDGPRAMTQREALETTLTSPPCPPDQRGCPEALPVPENVVITVNTYVGPQGEGYELVVEYIDEEGEVWRKVLNFGPEQWRERDWHKATPMLSPLGEPTP